MKKIVGYLKDYFARQCNYRYLAALVIFVGLAVWINFFRVSETTWIKRDPSATARLVKYLVGYAVIFGGAYGLQLLVDRDKALRSGKLWTLIAFAVVLFSVRAWYHPEWSQLLKFAPFPYTSLSYMLIVNALGIFMIGIPLAIYWFAADREHEPLYGFHAKGVVLWPYFVLILMMLPLVFWAGHQLDFQETYPRATRLGIPRADPRWLSGSIAYESLYSLDYVVTEFFFRGFLILPFSRIIGHKAILPMCAFYVSIHFDKPLGECVSSFFGGLVLGVLAYRSRSIYGGVIVHLGIALAMEVVGWWYMK